MGIPYEFLGRAQDGKAATIDCMGVVLEVYRRAGRDKSDPFADGADPVVASMEWIPVDPNPTSWPPLAVLQLSAEDDASGLATHLAVYLGAGLVIHATEESGVVVESVSQLTGSVISVVIGAECKMPW